MQRRNHSPTHLCGVAMLATLGLLLTVPTGSASAGAGTSAGVRNVTKETRPVITHQPNNAMSTGSPAIFKVSITGRPTAHLQWYKRVNNVWSSVTGATKTTFIVTLPAASVGTWYYVRAGNAAGSVTSRSVTVLLSGTSPTKPSPPNGVQGSGVVSTTSSNWSGYAETGGVFTAASATWIVPSLTCSMTPTNALQWVGVDGWGSSTVEQVGTETDCVNGSGVYKVWYEMWGDSSVGSGFQIDIVEPLAAGDVVSAAVTYGVGTWTFSISDATQGWSFNIPEPAMTGGTPQTSAEFIDEEPGACNPTCTPTQLAATSPVTFSDISVTKDGVAGPLSGTLGAITLLTPNGSGAEPGALSGDGASFTDTWTAGS